MAIPRTLWSARFTTSPEAAALFSKALEDGSLSLTTVAPPRTNKAEVEAIFGEPPDQAALHMRIAILASLHDIKPPTLHIRQLPKLDWLKKVAEDFPPMPIARWIVFGAQHKQAASAYKLIPLQIDATSAFGTGEHPTTRGCLLMLDWILKKNISSKALAHSPPLGEGLGTGSARNIFIQNGKFKTTPTNNPAPNPSPRGGKYLRSRRSTMLDMGCGSGILAMAYAKATRGLALGIDLDPDSVTIAKANLRANGLQRNMRVSLGNGYKAPLVKRHKPYDLIMANIFAGPLCRMAHDLKKHLAPNGLVILSGLLTWQANSVIAAHNAQGLRLIRHLRIGEWSVLAFRCPSRAICGHDRLRFPPRGASRPNFRFRF